MAKKSALDAIAALKSQMDKLAQDGIEELKEEFATFKAQADEAAKKWDQKLKDIDTQIVELGGASLMPKAKAAAKATGTGGGSRMKQSEKVEHGKNALPFIVSSGKEGKARGDVAEHLGIAPQSAATVLKYLIKEKKIKQIGTLKDARYVEA